MADKMEKIVFLEFVDEAEAFLRYCQNHGLHYNDFHIIALQPNVQVFLKNLGATYENTLPYFSNNEHKKALLKSEEWYKFVSDRLKIEDGSEIKETFNNTFLFYLRCYINHFLMYIETISSICSKNEVESIYSCLYQNKIRENSIPHIQDDERYFGIIAKNFAERHEIDWQKIPNTMKSKIDSNKTTFLNKNIGNMDKLILKPLNYILLNSNNKRRILLTTTAYNIDKLEEKTKNKFPDIQWTKISEEKLRKAIVKFIYSKIRKGRIEEIPLELFLTMKEQDIKNRQRLERNLDKFVEEIQKHSDYFNYEGSNFIEMFYERITKDLKPYVVNLHSNSVALRKILGVLNVKLCISPYARENALLTAELCSNKGISTLMISHGTLKKPENELEEIEYQYMGESLILSEFFKYVAVQTPKEIDVCKYYKCKNILIKTGSLIFSKTDINNREKYRNSLLGITDTETKVLIYPENTRLRRGMRFHVFETFDEFLSSASDMVNAINNIENVHLVIRLHSGREITPLEFKSLLPESNKLTVTSTDRPFFELLTVADLLINFSSTVIEDALQNYIPVLLYDKQKRYKHIESQDLIANIKPKVSAVYYLNDSSFLKNGLQWIVDNHLKKNISKSIFNKYVFKENYYDNFVEFISNKINT